MAQVGRAGAMVRVAGGFVHPDWALEQLGWSALLGAPVGLGAYRADDGAFLFANDAMFQLLGYTPEEIMEVGWLPLLYPEATEEEVARANIAQLAASPTPVRHQRRIVRGDGSHRLLDMTSRSFALPDGRRALITAAVDATDHWIVVDGAPRGFRELVDDAPDVLSRIDVQSGQFLFLSRGIERLLGWLPEEVYRDRLVLHEAVLPEYRARVRETYTEVMAGATRSLVMGARRRDGEVVLLHQHFYPVRDASGRVVVIEGLTRDITALRGLERRLEQTIDELKQRNEELASLDRLKSQLLANVSHELRTPLVSIKGYNELVLSGALGPLTARQRRGLEVARANTERLVELIETLLDFARREQGRLAIHRAPMDLRAAVREAAQSMQGRIAERGVRLTVELPERTLEVSGDAARLAQLFKALLSNAEKFSREHGEIHIAAELEPEGTPNSLGAPTITVRVSDNGIGVPVAARGKIFERFFQVDSSSTRRHGGAGLGLALAKEIVALHGGEIFVVDGPNGKGSTFAVRLPALLAGARAAGEDQRVLLVGAPPQVGERLKGELERAGFLVLLAASGEELCRRARRHRPDAVVLALPGAEAADALDSLRNEAETQGLPALALAGDEDRPRLLPRADYVLDAAQAERAGELLIQAVRRLLSDGPVVAPADTPAGRVVIVDDEPENLDFTRFVLEREGFEVTCVASGRNALEQVTAATQLVILDLAMEGVDGIEVCRRLKERRDTNHVPVLVVTAMTGEEVRRQAAAAGADGFLTKPFGVAEFLRHVRLHLRGAAEAG